MTLPLEVVGLVLLAALIHASWNALVKASGDRLVMQTLVIGGSALPAAPFVAVVGLPEPGTWIYLFLSVVVHTAYYLFLVQAYNFADLSHAYPIARGTGPLLVALLSGPVVGEVLSPVALLGVALVSVGIFGLASRGWHGNRRGLLFALGTGALIAGYTLIDGLGTRQEEAPWAFILWFLLLSPAPLVAIALLRRRQLVLPVLRSQWKSGLGAGVLAGLGYGAALWGMSIAPIAAVAALRETSVLFAALIGAWLLKEPFGRHRIAAAAVIAAGIATMRLAG